MKRELRDKWVDALRSGKYRQTTGKLKARNKSYCCLGVLCEVMGVEPVYDRGYGEYKYDGELGFLSTELHKKAGLKASTTSKLMRMNDETRMTFPEIADWIEKNIRQHRV